VPLSDHEQRLLEQMEQALSAEDPKFATAMRGSDLRRRAYRRVALAGAVFILGIVLLMTGAVAQIIPLGVVGFVIMLGSAFYGATMWRRAPAPGQAVADGSDIPRIGKDAPKRRGGSKSNKQGTFTERMEERWRRRRDDGFGR